MSQRDAERTRALVFLSVMCVVLGAAAVFSLASRSTSTPGVTVTAIILLAGAVYGFIASVVALARGPRGELAESEERDSASE